ncbi:MAG: hypothetical protein HYX53_05520 [Chloroflexi bacterium]|nr:hypothetical protein [Chloroflexota bacterium]
MLPELRAAADKLIFDTANIQHVVKHLPRKAADRTVEATGLTLRETFALISARQEWYARSVDQHLRGKHLAAGDGAGEQEYLLKKRRQYEKPPLKDALRALSDARDRLIAAFERAGDDAASDDPGSIWSPAALLAQAHHMEPHALDIAETVPELRGDPLLLNWAFNPDYRDRPDLHERQQRLFAIVRKDLNRADAGPEPAPEDSNES